MSDKMICGNCGTELASDSLSAPSSERTPCPNCGSFARRFVMNVTDHLGFADEVSASIQSYPERLLSIASELIGKRHYGIAVTVVHMACEVAASSAISLAYQTRGISDLEDSIDRFMSGYSLGNERIRRLYNAITGRTVQNEPFWNAFQDSAELRNKIMHSGQQANESQANASLAAGTKLVTYLLV